MNTDIRHGLKALWKNVFGDPDVFIDAFFQIAYSPDRCRFLTENGRIVSALYWLDCECRGRKLAYIYAVATAPEHRGKGLASRLLEETHVQLKAQGYAGAVLKPAAGLFPFYERLGYRVSGFVRRFSVEAGSIPAVLRELTATEYGVHRRKYLPENGIVQEGVTLEFLHFFARFYASDDALVCVSRDEPVIFEYLGSADSAPGILTALGMETATLQTVGNDIPYAMFLPLGGTPAPGYLGITLE